MQNYGIIFYTLYKDKLYSMPMYNRAHQTLIKPQMQHGAL